MVKIFKKTDVVVHLAAAGVQSNQAKQKEIFKTNVINSYKFINNAIKAGCTKFLIISTSSEYGYKSTQIKKLELNYKENQKITIQLARQNLQI